MLVFFFRRYLLLAIFILVFSSIFFILPKYFSSTVKLPEELVEFRQLPDIWWTPGTEKFINNEIKPYNITFSVQFIKDLKYRLKQTRPLTPPLKDVAWSYGTNTDALRKLIDYWLNDYNFEERQKFINQYPNYKTNIQGLDIHFIRVKPSDSKGKHVLPLLILHGWPGSIMEFYKIIPLLTTPRPEHDFVFEVVVPSLPGFGFSSAATIPGLSSVHMSVVLKNLMLRLGYNQFYVQGGDFGADIICVMSILFPQHILGMHSNLCVLLDKWILIQKMLYEYFNSFLDGKEQINMSLYRFLAETGYYHIQATKPDTIGIGLNDSPAGLAAYIIEKFSIGTNYYYKYRIDGGLLEKYTYDELIDNLMIYWASNSMTTAMRIYAEQFTESNWHLKQLINAALINVPSACAQFPNEIMEQHPNILKKRFVNLLHITKMPRGGHFAALEEPELFANDIWTSINKIEAWHKKYNNSNRDNSDL